MQKLDNAMEKANSPFLTLACVAGFVGLCAYAWPEQGYTKQEVAAVGRLIEARTPFYAKLGPDYERAFLHGYHPVTVSRKVAVETVKTFWPGRFH